MTSKTVAHCVSCKKEQEVLVPRKVVVAMTNGSNRTALRGVCGVCSRNIFAFTASKDKIDESEKSFWRGILPRFRWGSRD